MFFIMLQQKNESVIILIQVFLTSVCCKSGLNTFSFVSSYHVCTCTLIIYTGTARQHISSTIRKNHQILTVIGISNHH